MAEVNTRQDLYAANDGDTSLDGYIRVNGRIDKLAQSAASSADIQALQVSDATQAALIADSATKAEVAALQVQVTANVDDSIVSIAREPDGRLRIDWETQADTFVSSSSPDVFTEAQITATGGVDLTAPKLPTPERLDQWRASRERYTELSNGDTISSNAHYRASDGTYALPASPQDGDWVWIENASDVVTVPAGNLSYVTVTGNLRIPQGINIPGFNIVPGMGFFVHYDASISAWRAANDAKLEVNLSNIHSGMELRTNAEYEIDGSVAGMFFILPEMEVNSLIIRLASNSAHPIEIRQYDMVADQVLRSESGEISNSFTIEPSNAGEDVKVSGGSDRWRYYRPWIVNSTNQSYRHTSITERALNTRLNIYPAGSDLNAHLEPDHIQGGEYRVGVSNGETPEKIVGVRAYVSNGVAGAGGGWQEVIDEPVGEVLEWQPATPYEAGDTALQNRLSDGTRVIIERIADGTSNSVYNATEEAEWNEIGLAPTNIPILESIQLTTQGYASSWTQASGVVLVDEAGNDYSSTDWSVVADSLSGIPAGTTLNSTAITPGTNSTRTVTIQYSGSIQRRGLSAIRISFRASAASTGLTSLVAKYFNGETKIISTGGARQGTVTINIEENSNPLSFITRAELEPIQEENYGDLPLGTSDAVVDEYYFAAAPSGTNAETQGNIYLVQAKTDTIPAVLDSTFWDDAANMVVVGQASPKVRIPRLIAVDKVVASPDPIPSTEAANSRILYVGNTVDTIYQYDNAGAFDNAITDQPQSLWADGALLTDKETDTEYKYIRGTNRFELLQLLGGLPIVRYTADGAIQDIDHRAIFETGAVNMTLSASTIDRVIQMVSEGPTTVITANGAEQFTGGLGTSTDSKLTLNDTFKWATIIGRTAGGWSQYVGQVGIPDGVDIATSTMLKAGTRLVQNGVDAAPSVTFPEAFKVGTIPTIKIVAQDTGDNVNVTLQTVTNTGFTSWVVRNESDVGIASPTIHWEATGEVA